jgi:1-acyl-sn-glycerol-3-phosphate acyltransferase
LAGGYYSFKGSRFSVVFVSSILGTLSLMIITVIAAFEMISPLYVFGIPLGIVSFFLVLIFRKEFRTREEVLENPQ